MPRTIPQIIAHIRAVAANPAISTTLIQTEDLEALCGAAEGATVTKEQIALALCCPDQAIRCKSDTCGCQREYAEQIEAISAMIGYASSTNSTEKP